MRQIHTQYPYGSKCISFRSRHVRHLHPCVRYLYPSSSNIVAIYESSKQDIQQNQSDFFILRALSPYTYRKMKQKCCLRNETVKRRRKKVIRGPWQRENNKNRWSNEQYKMKTSAGVFNPQVLIKKLNSQEK